MTALCAALGHRWTVKDDGWSQCYLCGLDRHVDGRELRWDDPAPGTA